MRRVEFVPFRITDKVEIYTIRIDNRRNSELNDFLSTFQSSDIVPLKSDFNEILKVLDKISRIGVKESFFRPEGQIYDRLCAIPVYTVARDKNECGTLRLYCIRISESILIVGSGGCKVTQTYQEEPNLSEIVTNLQKIDSKLSMLENDGINLHKELCNLIIYI